MAEIREILRSYILREHLPDVDPDELTDDTELIDSGIIDSIARLRLRAYLEDEFDIELQGHELGFEHFGTLADITRLVQSKSGR